MVLPSGTIAMSVCLSCASPPSQRYPGLQFKTLLVTRPAPQFPPPQPAPPPQLAPPTPQPVPPRARRTPSHTRHVRPSGRHAETLARVADAVLARLADAGPAGLTAPRIAAALPRRDRPWVLRALLALRTEGRVTGPAANMWRTVGNPR